MQYYWKTLPKFILFGINFFKDLHYTCEDITQLNRLQQPWIQVAFKKVLTILAFKQTGSNNTITQHSSPKTYVGNTLVRLSSAFFFFDLSINRSTGDMSRSFVELSLGGDITLSDLWTASKCRQSTFSMSTSPLVKSSWWSSCRKYGCCCCCYL